MDDDMTMEKQPKKKHTVTWLTKQDTPAAGTAPSDDNDDKTSSISFEVYDGETLRTAALRRNIVSPHNGRANLINCRGLGTCGTCAVEVLTSTDDGAAAAVVPPQRNTVEDLRFNFPPHNFHSNSKLRLACQIQVRGDIQVLKRTGFWGQKDALAVPSEPKAYFGDLEYLLDNKSPEAPDSEQER